MLISESIFNINQKGVVNIIVIIGFVMLVGVAGYFFVNQQASSPTDETKCTDYSIVKINDNQSFIYTYNNESELQAIPEKNFEGVLKKYNKLSPDAGSTVMRGLTYGLGSKAVYTRNDDLSKYVGKYVVLTGKNFKFKLEGTQRDEIWPISIVCK